MASSFTTSHAASPTSLRSSWTALLVSLLAAQSALAQLVLDLPAPTATVEASPLASDTTYVERRRCSSLEAAAGASLCELQGEDADDDAKDQLQLDKRQQASTSSTGSSSSTVSIPSTAANGGITMLTPAATAQATFYKIASDNYITFGWNYTDVLVAPTSLTIQAYCSQNGYTYPVGPTSGLSGDTTSYAWNPYEYEQSSGATPLAEASYTLRIFRENGYAAAASAGYMKSYAGTIFALYRPQPYTALADGWTCAACSAALRATWIHPAVIATASAVLFGSLTVFMRL